MCRAILFLNLPFALKITNVMTIKFNIEYHTKWGENLVLVFGEKRHFMEYTEGGKWEITLRRVEAPAKYRYHYEVELHGKVSRREWGYHKIICGNSKGGMLLNDCWQTVPEEAPLLSGAFQTNILGDAKSGRELYDQRWKCAGISVPVFALRSKESFGVGDFHDLKTMVDLTEAMGMHVIQLLPINDTTMSGTWTDSYPYSANSIYALHPMFIYLPAAGVEEDEEYMALKADLEASKTVDYERVNREKDRLLRKAFTEKGAKLSESPGFKRFTQNNQSWLEGYCAFRILRDKFGHADFHAWDKYSTCSKSLIARVIKENESEAAYHAYVQYYLHKQLVEARNYAHKHGVIFKGDLPIGISRTSCDAWQNPSFFHLDSQAGAPPDAFSAEGQNWGLPTYNWEKMEMDGYAWWKERLKNMEQYFDAFRIDHILGFFRIWEIPSEYKSGLMGHFSPALPYSTEELRNLGFRPGDADGMDRLFLEDPRKKGYWHPRMAGQYTTKYAALPQWQKDSYNRLYDDFFYSRHNAFWKESAMRKLPELLASSDMLPCGEDLGMIPDCVPEVMSELRILSLEIQRMPKETDREFGRPWEYPYFSVCATSTHDMNPIRAWWHEDRGVTQRFYNEALGQWGEAPADASPEICERILKMNLASPSMLAIFPLQDYLSIAPGHCEPVPEDERINVPAITPYFWRYRMKDSLEAILSDEGIVAWVKSLVKESGR